MKNKKFKTIFSIILVCFCFVLAGCGKTPLEYEISTQINGANFGKVVGGGTIYKEGTEVTIKAIPYENNKFFCWLRENKVASTLEEYKFVVDSQTYGNYLALFDCADLEFICLDNFTITNGPSDSGNDQAEITNVIFSMGYNQNELSVVYSCNEEHLSGNENTVDSSVIYEEDNLPFAYDKTKDLVIKIEVKYVWSELEYASQDIIVLPKVDVGTPNKNIENFNLSLARNVTNANLSLNGSQNTKASINFSSIKNFVNIETNEDEV